MASDHHKPSRTKHQRTSDDKSDEGSKRHKHRHHHHHRRHRHHRSRKHEHDDIKQVTETEEISHSPHPPPSSAVAVVDVSNGNCWPDYDMEEGEIVDEEEGFDVKKKNSNSSDVVMEGVQVALNGENFYKEDQSEKVVGSESTMLGDNNIDDGFKGNATGVRKEKSSVDAKIDDGIDLQRNSNVENHVHMDIIEEEFNKVLTRGKGSCDDESEFRAHSRSLLSETAGRRHNSLLSFPSDERHHKEYLRTGRSKSCDRDGDRSGSESVLQDAYLLQTHQCDAGHPRDKKQMRDLDDETISGRRRDYQHGIRDLLSHTERGRSSSYSSHTRQLDRHQSLEDRNKYIEGSQEAWDADGERREMYKDRKREKEWEVRDSLRVRDRNRERERELEREKERRRGKEKGRSREKESDRVSRHHKYHDDIGCDERDRHSVYRHQRLDETEHRAGSRKTDLEQVHSSKTAHLGKDVQKSPREEVEQEDYQERIVLQLAEKEEEDLERIKEESRKRRQAILEKYKSQQSQKKLKPTSSEMVKENARQLSASVAESHDEGADKFASFSLHKSLEQDEFHTLNSSATGFLGDGTPKSERLDDMFCDDIFGDSPAGVSKQGKGDGLTIERSGLHDNWDDAEGYYIYRFGEVLDGRYEISAAHGKGVYSNVVRAKDLKAASHDPEEVAIKIIRNNDTMYKAGLEELVILKKLVGADQEDRRHCVRFLSSFKYRNHLCLVFESLHMNLREVLKKFGRNIGIKLTAVRAYAKQLFIALKHLKNCGVLHSDIKPDNMLVNEAKNVLKLSDFGNAMFAGKNEITPYLVSRFYRAPEIILGLPYDHPMDIWSVGCCLYELYTGKVLFPGPSNNDMLRLHMELKGPFPKKMLRKGAFTVQHFDQDLNFLATEEDPVTKKAIKRQILNIKPKDIGSIVSGSAGEDPKMLANFKDLLEKIFVLDPDKRITVSQALSHPFITASDTVPFLVEIGWMMFGWRTLSWRLYQWILFYCKTTRQRRFSLVLILDGFQQCLEVTIQCFRLL